MEINWDQILFIIAVSFISGLLLGRKMYDFSFVFAVLVGSSLILLVTHQ